MTQLEHFKKTMKHEPTGKILFYAEFIDDLLERFVEYLKLNPEVGASSSIITDDKNYTNANAMDLIAKKFSMFYPKHVQLANIKHPTIEDFLPYFADYDIPERAFINGIGVLEVPSKDSGLHFTEYVSPLRNKTDLKDMEEYPIADFSNANSDHMKIEVDKIHAENRVATSWVGHMYEDAWEVRGYEEYLMDMLIAPENCECLLERFTENNIKSAVAATKAGVDYLRTGDDVANQRSMMFNIDVWRKFQKKNWKKVYDAARAINPNIDIWYHSDGNIEDIIPELIEIGVTILNPVQPECMDIAKLKREYGKDLVFDGVIGTQTVMPFGTPEDVKEKVREAKEVCGFDGGLILSPTHVLEPEVPMENIIAFFEEAIK